MLFTWGLTEEQGLIESIYGATDDDDGGGDECRLLKMRPKM